MVEGHNRGRRSRRALGTASLAAIVVVIAIVGVASILVMGNGVGVSQASNSSSTSRSFATSTSTGASTYTSVASPASGLELSLGLNGTSISTGEELTATAVDVNTLTTADNVSAAKDWPIGNLAIGPCGQLNSPVGIAVLSGNYDAANVSSGKSLQIYDPAVYACPAMLSGIDGFLFQPSSDNATVYGSCGSAACFNETASAILSVTGYWTGGPSTFTSFPSGIYTVIAGDEWGGIAILHFAVVASGA
jgi:hypothetical protein